MNVITIESEAFQNLTDKISGLKDLFKNNINCSPLTETWLDISETCQLLKISKRTLQYYRDNKFLNFSQIGGKIYFKATDIDSLLNSHYVDSKQKR